MLGLPSESRLPREYTIKFWLFVYEPSLKYNGNAEWCARSQKGKLWTNLFCLCWEVWGYNTVYQVLFCTKGTVRQYPTLHTIAIQHNILYLPDIVLKKEVQDWPVNYRKGYHSRFETLRTQTREEVFSKYFKATFTHCWSGRFQNYSEICLPEYPKQTPMNMFHHHHAHEQKYNLGLTSVQEAVPSASRR